MTRTAVIATVILSSLLLSACREQPPRGQDRHCASLRWRSRINESSEIGEPSPRDRPAGIGCRPARLAIQGRAAYSPRLKSKSATRWPAGTSAGRAGNHRARRCADACQRGAGQGRTRPGTRHGAAPARAGGRARCSTTPAPCAMSRPPTSRRRASTVASRRSAPRRRVAYWHATSSRAKWWRRDQPVLSVSSESHGWLLRVQVADSDVLRLEAGAPAEIAFDALPGERAAARVARIAAQADAATATFEVELALEVSDPRLLSGLLGHARIAARPQGQALLVPLGALVDAGEQRTALRRRRRSRAVAPHHPGRMPPTGRGARGLGAADEVIVGGAPRWTTARRCGCWRARARSCVCGNFRFTAGSSRWWCSRC